MSLSSARPPPSIHFFHVSLDELSSSTPSVTSDGRQIRKRRSHVKSRSGCSGCRQRRVKCDESRPSCKNCIKRGLSCNLKELSVPTPHKGLEPDIRVLDEEDGISPHINMLHLKLLHHFEHVTSETLVFDSRVWRKDVLEIAFRHDFLMHAILMISATHLSHLLPADPQYRQASGAHLSKTLSLFRSALSQPFTASNVDAFLATSTLLVHHGWANFEPVKGGASRELSQSHPSEPHLDLSSDPLFTLSEGLREVFVEAIQTCTLRESIFAASARHRPVFSIARAVNAWSKDPKEFEELFARCFNRSTYVPYMAGSTLVEDYDLLNSSSGIPDSRPCAIEASFSNPITRVPRDSEAAKAALRDTTSRVALILSYLQAFNGVVQDDPIHFHPSSSSSSLTPSSSSRDSGLEPTEATEATASAASAAPLFPPMSDLARYFFSFPIRSTPEFMELARQNDPRALVLLFYFYRAIRVLLPERQCWWSKGRAAFLETAIERLLGEEEDRLVLAEGSRLLASDYADILKMVTGKEEKDHAETMSTTATAYFQ